MKAQKVLSLDAELIESLKGTNASALVNEFLKDYFAEGKNEIKDLEEQEKLLKKQQWEIGEKLEEVRRKLKKIEEKNKENREAMIGIPDIVIEDFQFYPNMPIEVFKKRIDEVYLPQFPRLTEQKLLEAYERNYGEPSTG